MANAADENRDLLGQAFSEETLRRMCRRASIASEFPQMPLHSITITKHANARWSYACNLAVAITIY